MKFFKAIRDKITCYLYDSSIDMKDRMFVVFSISYFLALLAAGIVGFVLNEPVKSIITTVVIVVFVMG
nr:hypothetical protein [Lachnospiraceae bacterium]